MFIVSVSRRTAGSEKTKSNKQQFPIHRFTHSPIHRFTHSPIHLFTHSPIHRFTHSPIHL
ncbi:MAG: hypothetical protein COS10_09780 [Nitrospirae bacterium CG01_land_8_20_14_3_00_44_22]|nr:MAG: hypothetical protein COS10_09780 [Nitrospirae bacterium CG01_land_8_20_14_3_00_44_22]